nr:hypothetical protein [Tanacetum cinerariifolium]
MPMDPLDPYAQLVMEAPHSPNYIPGPEAPPSPDYIPGPEYPEYLPPTDDVFPAEEQPLPTAVSPTVESPGYITDSKPEMGDDDANNDGDDLSEDGADDEDEEESSDSEEEEEEHLAPTVPAPALHTTPPPFAYRITAKISVRPHIPMPFPSESEVERLLAIPTPPLSPVSPTSYPLPPVSMVLMRSAAQSTFILAPLSRTPPIGTPPLLPIPLPTSSFPLPLLLPSTSCREDIPEADVPLRKRVHFTTPTGGYEVGESSVAAAAVRQIRPALTIDDSRRAEDRLIGRRRREWRYFRTLSTTYARKKMAPKRARTTRANPDPTRTTTATEPMTQEAINNLIAQRVTEALAKYKTQGNSVINGDTSHTTGTGPRTVCPTRDCTYKDYLNYGPLKFKGTEGVIDEIERYVGGLPKMIRGNVMSYEPKSMQKAIKFANDQMDQKLIGIADHQADNKRKFNNTSRNQQNQQPFKRNNNVARAYVTSTMMDHVVPNTPTARGLAI